MPGRWLIMDRDAEIIGAVVEHARSVTLIGCNTDQTGSGRQLTQACDQWPKKGRLQIVAHSDSELALPAFRVEGIGRADGALDSRQGVLDRRRDSKRAGGRLQSPPYPHEQLVIKRDRAEPWDDWPNDTRRGIAGS